MDLDFSEEQELLRETARRICENAFDMAAVRALEQQPDGFDRGFWAALGENGLCGLRINREQGGAGLGALELAILFEEFGAMLASSPFLESCVHAARLIGSDPASGLARDWLPRIATGEAIVVPAWLGSDGESPCPSISGGTLTGANVLVPFASVAHAFLVWAERGGIAGWVLVDAASGGVTITAQANHASQPLFKLAFDNTPVAAANFLPDAELPTSSPAFDDVLIAAAAEAVGSSTRLLGLTVDYANQRNQFGRAIASFQAISHPLAECATELEAARYLTFQAAWAQDEGLPCSHLARMAKHAATTLYRRLAATSVQVHGGIGYSTEGDPQLFYRRAKHLMLMNGTPDRLKTMIADHVLG